MMTQYHLGYKIRLIRINWCCLSLSYGTMYVCKYIQSYYFTKTVNIVYKIIIPYYLNFLQFSTWSESSIDCVWIESKRLSEEAWHLLVHSPHVYFRLPAHKKLACYKPHLQLHSIYSISISFNMWWTEYRFASHPSDKSFLISSFSGIHFERHTDNNYTLQHIKVYFWVQKVQFQIFVVLVRLWRYVTRILFATVNFETNIQDIPEMISGRKHQE